MILVRNGIYGRTNAKAYLKNPKMPKLKPVEVDAMADSRAMHLCIPERIRIQLELDEIDKNKC